MFNKLLISTSKRRQPRTARFFVGTFVFYALSVAAAFALSIIFSNPQLADTSTSVLLLTPAPAPAGGTPRPPFVRQPTQAVTRNDPTHINDLSDVVAMKPSTAPRPNAPTGPPSVGPIDPNTPIGEGPAGPGGPGG